jgi:hypothetical protein
MTIRREARKATYTNVDNRTVRDAALTWEARGMLVYILSMPDHWSCQREQLVAAAPNGETQVRRILGELEAAGYMTRTRARRGDGTFEWVREVHERPVPPDSRTSEGRNGASPNGQLGLPTGGPSTGGKAPTGSDQRKRGETAGRATGGFSTGGQPPDIATTGSSYVSGGEPSRRGSDDPDPGEENVSAPEVSDDARRLCRLFAVGDVHDGGELAGARGNGHVVPRRGSRASARWLEQMDLLLRRGAVGDHRPVPADTVEMVIRWVLQDHQDGAFPGEAIVVASPGKLRKRWTELLGKAQAAQRVPAGRRAAADRKFVAGDLTEEQARAREQEAW